MERDDLRSLLREVKSGGFMVPEGFKPFTLASDMMNYLGDTDGELRDNLIYSILSNWIVKGILSTWEVNQILAISLDDRHLLYGLGNTDDTVFVRTFSLLIIAAAIYRHRSTGYLSSEMINNVLEKVLKLYNEDNDVRAYVEGKGWADGVSHGADALDELARCEEAGYEGLKRILNAIQKKVNINWYSYCHDEDERMVTAVTAILDKKLIPENEEIEWIESFAKLTLTGHYPTDLVLSVNIKNFLRSLYFRLAGKAGYTRITDVTVEILNKMNKYR